MKMKFQRLFSSLVATVVSTLVAFFIGSAARATPASGVLQAAPIVRSLAAPASDPGVERARYYSHHWRYWHPF
jgi:hypothetical protein